MGPHGVRRGVGAHKDPCAAALAEAGLYADARRALERAVEVGRYDAAAVRRITASLERR